MNSKRIPAGEHSGVYLKELPGDLHVTTWAEQDILVSAEGDIAVATQGAMVEVACQKSCILTLPANFDFRFDEIAGDAHIAELAGAVEGKKIKGDLRLQNTGPVSLGAVGGDVTALHVTGGLQLGAAGGDLRVEDLRGNLNAGVGGDLRVISAAGGIAANTGGDASLELKSLQDEVYAVQAGGDILLRLQAEADATLNLQYGGTLHMSDRFTRQSAAGHTARVVLGSGHSVLNLIAGGDISLRAGSAETSSKWCGDWSNTDFNEEFTRQMDNAMRSVGDNLEAQLGAMARQLDAQLGGIVNGEEIAARVNEKIRRAMERAEASVEKAMHRAQRQAARSERRSAAARARADTLRWPASRQPAKPSPPPVSDEERLAILRMVEQGTISVEQAEQLLAAMER